MARLETVTQYLSIVRDDLDRINDRALAKAAARGTLVHQLCFNHIQNLPLPAIDYSTEDRRLALLYLESFAQWWDEKPRKLGYIEPTLCHPVLKYVGHPDLVLDDALIDIKTPMSPSWKWRLQMAAYLNLAMGEYGLFGWSPKTVGCLMLSPKGDYPKLITYNHAELLEGYARFLECRNLYLSVGK